GDEIARRRAFARANTWNGRAAELSGRLVDLWPLVSILVVTHDGLAWTRMCLDSIDRRTDWPRFEIVVADNASTDGTREWLGDEERRGSLRAVLLRESELRRRSQRGGGGVARRLPLPLEQRHGRHPRMAVGARPAPPERPDDRPDRTLHQRDRQRGEGGGRVPRAPASGFLGARVHAIPGRPRGPRPDAGDVLRPSPARPLRLDRAARRAFRVRIVRGRRL